MTTKADVERVAMTLFAERRRYDANCNLLPDGQHEVADWFEQHETRKLAWRALARAAIKAMEKK